MRNPMGEVHSEPLLTTPLDALHRELGARMVPFAGYAMPVQYSGILAEHAQCRERAALFDVSHMGLAIVTPSGGSSAAARRSRRWCRAIFCPCVGRDPLHPVPQRRGRDSWTTDGHQRRDHLFVVVNAACKTPISPTKGGWRLQRRNSGSPRPDRVAGAVARRFWRA
jgi:aminomethyltransferase